jgi:hypothetical protein
MLLRAQAIPPGFGPRYLAIAAAALELGRSHRDMDVVNEATEIVRNPYGDSISLTAEQARGVVKKELASPAFPSPNKPGPDYGDLMPKTACQCAKCRAKRGEIPDVFDEEEDEFDDDVFGDDEFDEVEMERVFKQNVPKGIPPELARMLYESMREAFLSGVSPDEIMEEILNEGGKKKKGRRK